MRERLLRWTEPAVLVRIALYVGAALAFVLGYIGLTQLRPPLTMPLEIAPRWTDYAYWTFQLFLLDSAPLQEARDPGVLLEIARFLAPITVATAVVLGLRERVARFRTGQRIRRWRDHTVVVGEAAAALRVARSVVAEGRRCVVVDPARPDRQPRRDRASSRSRQASVVRTGGDGRDVEVLRAAGAVGAREIVVVGEDDARQVEIAAAAHALLPPPPDEDLDADPTADPTKHPRPPSLFCIVEVGSAATVAALTAHEMSAPRAVRVEFVDRSRRAARALLDDALPSPEVVGSVAVVGRGATFDALCQEARDRIGSQRLRSGVDASPVAESAVDLVVVAVDEVDDAARLALEAFVHVRGTAIRIVVATGATISLAEHLAVPSPASGAHVTVVDATSLARDVRRLRDGLYQGIARSVHEAYLREDAARGPDRPVNPSAVAWENLPRSLQESNLAQAFHIGAKMRQLRCVVVPEDAAAGAPSFTFTPAEVETLAKMEHNRWVRDRLGNGWRPGVKDATRKRSPYLVPWGDLPDEKVKDLDREAVRALPGHVAAAGYRIVRL